MMLLKNRSVRISFAEILFVSTIFVLPFEQLITVGRFSIIKWIGLLFFFVSVFEWKKFYGGMPVEFLYFLAYISIGVTWDVIYSTHDFEALNEILRPVLFFILMLATYNLVLIGRARRIITCLVLSSLVLAIYQTTSLWSSATRVWVEGAGYEDRIAALGTDPNFTACFITLSVVASVMLLLNVIKCPIWLRVASMFSLLLGIGGIVKTSSRGGLLALVLGLCALAFTGRQWHKKLLTLVGVGITLGGIYISVRKSDLFVKRISTFVDTGDTAGRYAIWEGAWGLIKEAPWLGYGYRAHPYYLGAVMDRGICGTHNTFIASVLSSGFIGAFFFILLFMRSGWAAWQCRRSFPGNILLCWFMICFGMGMTVNGELAKWFWIVLSLCLGAYKMQEKQRMRMTSDYAVGNNRGAPVSGKLDPSSSR
jgi:O-antigen ligase